MMLLSQTEQPFVLALLHFMNYELQTIFLYRLVIFVVDSLDILIYRLATFTVDTLDT